jgi:DNA-binding LacI/PurR family transcriptional regulator
MATLKDIAQKSECSISLVSRVLDPNACKMVRVSPEKRQKIQKEAAALGYMRNVHAQFLRQGKTATIGVFLVKNRNSLISDLSMGIGNEACKHNFPMSYYYGQSPECFAKFLEHNLSVSTTGIISYPHLLNDASGTNLNLLRRYLDSGGHAVFINYLKQIPKELDDVPIVNIDDVYGGNLAAEHLLSLGCNEFIANIDAMYRQLSYVELRFQGFHEALGKHDCKNSLVDTPRVAGLVKKAIDKKRLPGVFSLSDLAAVKVMNECENRYGLRAGRDYKIIGYDNLFLSDQTNPPLTTIDQNFELLGQLAVEKLVKMICYGKKEKSVVLNPSLIIRKTA